MRLIYVDDFLDLFYVASAGQDRAFIETVEMVVEDTPTIDAVPVVRAHWIRTDSGKWRCSACRGRHDYPMRYCGECGARMNERRTDNG